MPENKVPAGGPGSLSAWKMSKGGENELEVRPGPDCGWDSGDKEGNWWLLKR